MLGIGSGSTIVHAVQRIGVFSGDSVFCVGRGGGDVAEKQEAGTGGACPARCQLRGACSQVRTSVLLQVLVLGPVTQLWGLPWLSLLC